MKALVPFILPISGLKPGMHQFEMVVNDEFFSHFEHSPIKKAAVKVKLYLDRRPSIMELTFDFEGIVHTDCDRCLQFFNLPIKGSNTLLVKMGEAEIESDDVDLIFISPKQRELDISNFVYEFVLLSIPMVKKHQDAGEACGEDFSKYLSKQEIPKVNNPIWDALKNLDKN